MLLRAMLLRTHCRHAGAPLLQAELQAQCEQFGVEKDGDKNALVDRLLEVMVAEVRVDSSWRDSVDP